MMRDFMAITKALADEQRMRMLLALRQRELCVCQIVELVGLATSTVSKHMSILKQAGLVESRKEGRWMYYRLPSEQAPAAIRQALSWAFEHLGRDVGIRRDQQKLEQICRVDPQDLCAARCAAPSGNQRRSKTPVGCPQ